MEGLVQIVRTAVTMSQEFVMMVVNLAGKILPPAIKVSILFFSMLIVHLCLRLCIERYSFYIMMNYMCVVSKGGTEGCFKENECCQYGTVLMRDILNFASKMLHLQNYEIFSKFAKNTLIQIFKFCV